MLLTYFLQATQYNLAMWTGLFPAHRGAFGVLVHVLSATRFDKLPLLVFCSTRAPSRVTTIEFKKSAAAKQFMSVILSDPCKIDRSFCSYVRTNVL